MESKKKIEENYCIKCDLETKQVFIAEKGAFSPQEIFSKDKNGLKKSSAWVIKKTDFKLLECSQCETPSLKIGTGIIGGASDKKQICSYPTKPKIKIPSFIQDLQPKYYSLMFEIYSAINHGNNILAAMGVRCLVDAFLNAHIGDIGGFDRKLEAAQKAGVISLTQKNLLESIVEAGHASSHRSYRPADELLLQSMSVVESLLANNVAHLKMKKLIKKVPKRKSTLVGKKKATK